jgi:hypothetical protein
MARKSYVIGRAGDITLYDDTVSRRHACLEVEGDQLFLRDLDSRNGTFEIRNDKLVPFPGGAITVDQVFAFGECVRSVRQLLDAIGVEAPKVPAADESAAAPAPPAPDATRFGLAVAPRQRLSPSDIVGLLEQVEDGLAVGRTLEALCESLGFSEQRYLRWSKEYGRTRAERERTVAELRRENDRLRKLVADLSLERDVLKEALKSASERPAAPPASPSLTIVSEKKS